MSLSGIISTGEITYGGYYSLIIMKSGDYFVET